MKLSLKESRRDAKVEGIIYAADSEVELFLTEDAFSGTRHRMRVLLAMYTRSRPVEEMLKVLASTLPGKHFSRIYTSFLVHWQKAGVSDNSTRTQLEALQAALLSSVKAAQLEGHKEEGKSDWDILIQTNTSPPLFTPPSIAIESTDPVQLSLELLEISLFSLRILSEEWKLLSRRRGDVALLAPMLVAIASRLGALDYVDASVRDGGWSTGQLGGKPGRPGNFEEGSKVDWHQIRQRGTKGVFRLPSMFTRPCRSVSTVPPIQHPSHSSMTLWPPFPSKLHTSLALFRSFP